MSRDVWLEFGQIIEVMYTEKEQEINMNMYGKIRKFHKNMNHKIEQNIAVIRRTSREVVKRCEVCQRRKKSCSVLKVSMMILKSFNDIIHVVNP